MATGRATPETIDEYLEAILGAGSSEDQEKIPRCPKCRVALWSNCAGAGDAVRFARAGTLDEAGRFPPDIHIFTSTKQPWVVLPPNAQAVPEFYKFSERWPKESHERRAALMAARQ